jgi:probable rRNA maturation factor
VEIDILIEEDRWEAVGLDALAQAAFAATVDHQGLGSDAVEISLLACDDARIAQLNGDFRAKPTPTNVLSWPTEDLAAANPGDLPNAPTPEPDGSLALGDIAIAYETCHREAEALGKPISAHVTHLLVHGLLHLLGYDHIRDVDAELMQGIETEILGKMGLDDPYIT